MAVEGEDVGAVRGEEFDGGEADAGGSACMYIVLSTAKGNKHFFWTVLWQGRRKELD